MQPMSRWESLRDGVGVSIPVHHSDAKGLNKRRAQSREWRKRGSCVHSLGGLDKTQDVEDENCNEQLGGTGSRIAEMTRAAFASVDVPEGSVISHVPNDYC